MADAAPWREIAAAVRTAIRVVPVGAGTHSGIGGPVRDATEIRAPRGVVTFEPADMTATVRAGTTCAELEAVLAEHGQECPLDPRDPAATVGGVLASGLSGIRRLAIGPLREQVLEVTLVTADGRVVRGGGPTVKNVTGYDVPRLFVGSLGTLGVAVQVIVRTRPIPVDSRWFVTDEDPAAVVARAYRPTAALWDGTVTRILLEGQPADVGEQAARLGLTPGRAAALPAGPHRGRISVAPGAIPTVGAALGRLGARWTAEVGVGTVHVAADDPGMIDDARDAARHAGGWLLRESGAPDLDPFGTEFPAAAVQVRLRSALDPTGKLAPGRVPATEPTGAVAA